MKKRPIRRRRRQKDTRLNFVSLEKRQLLAGDLAGPHQVEFTLPVEANVLVNGDFENVSNADDNFYAETDVDGWLTIGANTELNIFDFQGYGNVLDLDSTTAEFDRVYQNVDTEVGAEYLVTFDFRKNATPQSDTTPDSYDFEVWWNNEQIHIYEATDTWQTGTIRVSADSLSTVLLFCEVREAGFPDGGDGIGPLLDNIRVFTASELSVDNGGFEVASNPVGAQSVIYHSNDVPSWGHGAADLNDRFIKIVPGSNTINAPEGQQYLNLDTTDANQDVVFRDLATTAGRTYYVTFDMRIDGQGTTDSDELRVRWNGSWAGTFQGADSWQNYGLMLTADSELTRLEFLETGLGDGSGPLIDNVRMFSLESDPIELDLNGEAAGVDTTARYVAATGSQVIAPDLVINHPSDDRITSATVSISGVVDGSNELLAIAESNLPLDGQGNAKINLFNYQPATRTLQLTGEATVAEYQQVLRSLVYFNGAGTPGTTDRLVQVTVANNNLPTLESTASAEIQLSFETNQAAIDDAILAKFIANNNLNAVPVSNGLYAVIDEPGSGANPDINSTVRVNYTGRFLTLNDQNQIVEGDSFDSSSAAGITFPLANVIQGWQIGIPQFATGGSGKLLIPSALGYGVSGTFGIPGNSVLVFDVELLEIV